MGSIGQSLHEPESRPREDSRDTAGRRTRDGAEQLIRDVCAHRNGVGVLVWPEPREGNPPLRELIQAVETSVPTAVVDARDADEARFSGALLEQFGFEGYKLTKSERLSLLKYFVAHKAAGKQPPLVVVDHAHAVQSGTGRLLDELTRIRTPQGESAIRLVLVGDRSLITGEGVPALRPILGRKTADGVIQRADAVGGVTRTGADSGAPADRLPARAVPGSLTNPDARETDQETRGADTWSLEDWEPTQNLPPCLDAADGIDSGGLQPGGAAEVPAGDADAPLLEISVDGRVTRRFPVSKSKCTIGRSRVNDVPIDSAFVSRHHVLIMWFDGMPLLVDLNSRNGVLVNGARVDSQVLAHGDVISVGRHRVRYHDAPSRRRRMSNDVDASTAAALSMPFGPIRSLLARRSRQTSAAADY